MAWYDPLLIVVFVTGVLLLIFSHGHEHYHRRNVTWGLVLIFVALIIKAFLWFEGLI